MRRRPLRLLLMVGAGGAAGLVTAVAVQLLMAQRLERLAMRRLGLDTALQVRLVELALERLPREGVAAASGLDLLASPAVRQSARSGANTGAERAALMLQRELCRQLTSCPRVRGDGRGGAGVWVELPSTLEPAWLWVPLPRVTVWPPRAAVISLSTVAAALVVTSLYLELEVRRPLLALRRSVNAVNLDSQLTLLPPAGTPAIQQVTERFNAMVQRLERGRREQATMLAGIAHDLRAPLTRLRLRLAIGPGPDDAVRHQADLDALERMIAQFMAYAASQRQEPWLKVRLDELVGEAAAAVGVDLELDLQPLEAVVQPVALGRAVTNLLDNAMTYGTPPLHISLQRLDLRRASLRSPNPKNRSRTPQDQAEAADGFVIQVADCGPGLTPAAWQRALEPFQRLDPARGGHGHCGLGLAIAQHGARLHGGELGCEQLAPSQGHPQRFAVWLSGRSHPVTSPPAPVTVRSHPDARVGRS